MIAAQADRWRVSFAAKPVEDSWHAFRQSDFPKCPVQELASAYGQFVEPPTEPVASGLSMSILHPALSDEPKENQDRDIRPARGTGNPA